ncbi:hypothetical protein E2C01_078836 [Portunus trituberculatus]|uniref:Uncharacterized protein n=1 Tax=Portunus trituberculatus TaxID=210409 RepID=A0A5B7IPS7_PORTR|nr:hypothetical protein [Portunus trituberculatus]
MFLNTYLFHMTHTHPPPLCMFCTQKAMEQLLSRQWGWVEEVGYEGFPFSMNPTSSSSTMRKF